MSNLLFSKTESDNQEDIWDDTALIRAYERSVKQINKKLNIKPNFESKSQVKESQMNMDDQEMDEEDEDEDEEEDEEEEKDEDEDEENLNEGQQYQYASSSNLTKREIDAWKVGDLCMTIFSEDGLLYKAEIVSIVKETKKCVIRYLYYLNEEEKALDELFELNDKKTVEEETAQSSMPKSSSKNEPKFRNPLASQRLTMPPPPPPPALTSFFNSNNITANRDEELYTMLMSWYMSGYHTGYYFGLNHKNSSKTNKKN